VSLHAASGTYHADGSICKSADIDFKNLVLLGAGDRGHHPLLWVLVINGFMAAMNAPIEPRWATTAQGDRFIHPNKK